MKTTFIAALAAIAVAVPAFAEGDAAAGARDFNRCKACHSITAPDGTVIVRGGRVGPNLYGVVGRTAGSEEGFRYGSGLLALKDAGLVWDADSIVAYLADPTAFVRDKTGDNSLRSNMAFKLANGADVVAYLQSVAQ
ncbi:MAG: cytochrome C [Limimaricola sp.]|uniref:c-type cytochrome n=1 Tax=Limimaricola sp. TaxID=2211665 RepID=UPI001DB2FAAF|nr:cytochrome C [Limimaricola sp.]MBI1415663.1 cytochrome C [Limimaricola sp.]